jgi:flagellar L-ring protein precursor FlgH
MRRAPIVTPLLLLSLLGPACAIRRPAPEPRVQADTDELMRQLDALPAFPEPLAASGSIWTDGGPGAALVRDPRAFRVNDLVTVLLDERSLGTNESLTDLNRSSAADFGADIAFGLEDDNPQTGEFNLNQVLSTQSESTFSGDGTTSRGNRLNATLTARVLRVLPNGDLVVAGQKTVMVNRERQILTLVGSVRPLDLDGSNRVSSAKVGDLTARLWGRGEIDGTIRQGWFMKIMNRIWPF